MSVTLGGSNGITYTDGTTTPAASVTAVYSPNITDTANVMSARGVTKVIGGSGILAKGYLYDRNTVFYTFSSSTANVTLNVSTITGYVAGVTDVVITVNPSIYIYSTSTGTPALSITGATTGDTIYLTNHGYILGMGGTGGQNTGVGAVGGTALSISANTTVDNTDGSAYIAGGGGGGGGGTTTSTSTGRFRGGGGGGAGGGTGGQAYTGAGGASMAGGVGGAIGQPGGVPATGSGQGAAGGGGGRVLPGTGGTGSSTTALLVTAGGSGGGGGASSSGATKTNTSTAGGNGGSANAAGSAGTVGSGSTAGGGGGGWGASGGTGGAAGGAGGKAVALNGKTITWVSGNTTRVYGSVA